MTDTSGLVPIHTHFEPIAQNYQALLCDIWGVLHNGVAAYDGIVDALTRYRASGGRVLLLSNAPRPGVGIPGHLEGLGVPRDAYDDVLTSGDATRESIASGRFGSSFWHLGPERDRPTFEGLPISQTDEDKADFVLCTGLFDDETETADDYAETLARLKERDLDLVCANPDIVVDRGEKRVYCGGAIAGAYSEIGGRSHYFGKPHAPIYDLARARLSDLEDDQILAVGDGLLTDIKGANDQGIDALFVTGGIAYERCGPTVDNPQSELVTEVLAETDGRAIGAMARLVW
ncbi:MAG: TIGR01459 family HAD-type hydrolase [Rhodobiaceae bacterium]|nr:TIGR01459 family HAD-type hydrolase [Rhodobiaceae bacterium]